MLGYRNILLSSILVRRFTTTPRTYTSHYDALGLAPSANQSDIKSAYYKLSMMYHPDKSSDTESANKFRAITEAYEVLGNIKLKKMYDKGLLVGRNKKPDVHYQPEPEPTDPTIKFYKSRVNRTVTPTLDGRTPVYDFDTWAKAHYGETLRKNKYAKEMNQRRAQNFRDIKNTSRQETYVYLFLTFICLLVLMVAHGKSNYDLNKIQNRTADSNSSINDK